MLSVVLSVAVLSCGNYGYPEGYRGDEPIFTNKPIVGAGVENIRTRAIGCRKGRRMVKAFWNDQFVCDANGTRCTYGSFRCGNRRLGEELWLMRCFHRDDRDRMLKFRFGHSSWAGARPYPSPIRGPATVTSGHGSSASGGGSTPASRAALCWK